MNNGACVRADDCHARAPAMTSAPTMVERRCATTMVVRPTMRLFSASCTIRSLVLSSALVACPPAPSPPVTGAALSSCSCCLPIRAKSSGDGFLAAAGASAPAIISYGGYERATPHPAGGCGGFLAGRARWQCAASGRPTSARPSRRYGCCTCMRSIGFGLGLRGLGLGFCKHLDHLFRAAYMCRMRLIVEHLWQGARPPFGQGSYEAVGVGRASSRLDLGVCGALLAQRYVAPDGGREQRGLLADEAHLQDGQDTNF